jgi:hypothetical protein
MLPINPKVSETVDSVMRDAVLAVCSDASHRFGKTARLRVRFIEGHGIDDDAHAGAVIRHRYLARREPQLPNDRQVHLLQSELFDDLRTLGYDVGPGELGENVTTRGLKLLELPLGSLLRLGSTAVVELTGLRTPCGYIDKYQKGLKRQMIVRTSDGPTFRCGAMGIVRASGEVSPADPIAFEGAPEPWRPLPAI